MPLCRLTQVAQAIAARKDEEFYVRARTVEWHARTVSMFVASGISEESLAGAQAVRFFPEDEDDTPRDASGAPETVRVGGGPAPVPAPGSVAPEAEPARFAPDPEPVRAGTGTRVVSESDVGGVRVADTETVEKMFGIASIPRVVQEGSEDGRGY